MADNTKIEWADATVNYLNGCSVKSAGCANCFAMRAGERNLPNHPSTGLTRPTKAGHVWTGEVRANEKMLAMVLRWKQPRRIFWNAHGDLFHENVPDAWIDCQFAVMALTPHHTHMVLTKRPERMRAYFADDDVLLRIDSWIDSMINERIDPLERRSDDLRATAPDLDETWPLPNVWLGTSVEDQRAADERIPHLLATPAAVRFLSCEPLLGPVFIEQWLHDSTCNDWPGTCICSEPREDRIDWVIAGGESGKGARPMHPDWARDLRDQCRFAGVPFHFKQHGEWVPLGMKEPLTGGEWPANSDGCIRLSPDGTRGPDGWLMQRVGKARAGRLLDGCTHDEFPGSPANG